MAQQHSQLGPLRGPGTTTSDSIPAMYSKGEVVISAADVKAIGKAFGKNYLSNLVKTASKDATPKLGAQTMVKDGKLKASGGFGLDGEDVSGGIDWNQGKTDWNQGKTDWNEGMPDWNEGQTKFMGGTLFAAGGFNPEDLTPFGNKKIIPTNNRGIAPRTNLGTRAIIPASDAIPKTKARIGVLNTKAALGNSAVISPEQALKSPGKNIVPSGDRYSVKPSIPAEHINIGDIPAKPPATIENITIPDVSQARIGQGNKPVLIPTENVDMFSAFDSSAVNQAKQHGAMLDEMARQDAMSTRPKGDGFKSFNNAANDIKSGINNLDPIQGVKSKIPDMMSKDVFTNSKLNPIAAAKGIGTGIATNEALGMAGNAAYNALPKSIPGNILNAARTYALTGDTENAKRQLFGAKSDVATPVVKLAGNVLGYNDSLVGKALGEGGPDITNTAASPAINTPKTTAPIGSMAKPTPGQYSPYLMDQMFPGQNDKVAPSSSSSEDTPQYKTQPGFIQTDNGIPYNVAKQSDGTNTINFTNPDGTGTGTLSGLSGKQAGRFHDGKGAAYSGPGLPDVRPSQIGAQQMQQPYLGENNSGVDESNAYLDQMRDIAVNGGPDRFMSLSEMIAAKHRQRAAQDVLSNISQDNQNKRQNSLENAKLGVDTLLAKQRMDQAKTQQEYEAAQQDFMNSLEVGKIGYQMKRDEKGDQAASAKAAQENELAQAKLGIEKSQLNQPKPITTNTYDSGGLVNGQDVGVVQYSKDGVPKYSKIGGSGNIMASDWDRLKMAIAKDPSKKSELLEAFHEKHGTE